jgi:hypothetical protein
VLDRIAGQDRDRTAGLELQIEQALRQRVDRALGLAIAQLAPLPLGAIALRQPDPVGLLTGPFCQRGRDMLLIRL